MLNTLDVKFIHNEYYQYSRKLNLRSIQFTFLYYIVEKEYII